MRIGIIGYGAVASVHASEGELGAVYGPDAGKAKAFAKKHRIPVWTTELPELFSQIDAVLIASPSGAHFSQAHAALEAGVHALIELPPCESAEEAETLRALAARRGLVLRCAHTSRWLEPYRRIREWICEGRLGAIRQLAYMRHLILRQRSWTDDALLHHTAHPLDLILDWFDAAEIQACTADRRNVSALLILPGNAAASITVSYDSRLPQSRLLILGEHHTIETDGFSYIGSDKPAFEFRADGDESYHGAIRDQDASFRHACEGAPGGVGWEQTVRLMRLIEDLRRRASVRC